MFRARLFTSSQLQFIVYGKSKILPAHHTKDSLVQKAIAALFATWFLITPNAYADLVVTSRSSLLSTNIDFGYVGSVTNSTDSFDYTTIDDMLLLRQGSATDGGPLGDISWDASYQYSVEQQLLFGSPHAFSAGGSTSLFTFVGGDGVSYLSSTNRLDVEFENSAPALFDISLIATHLSRIDLERQTSPGAWELVLSNSGSVAEVAATLPLEAGAYRLSAQTDANTDNGSSNGGSWSFSVTPVPEPSTLALAAIGGALALFGARRNQR